MTLLSESTEGMHNLFRLSTGAWQDGFFKQPRMDRELLARHSAGIIGTTGCPSGEVQVHLRHDNYDAARQAAADYQDILGRDNYFLELMDHGLPLETPGPRRAAQAVEGPADPAAGDQRLPLRHARRTRRARSTCSASTPARRWTSRPVTARASGSPSTAPATTSSPPPRCARSGASCPRPATTPCWSPSAATSSSPRATAPTCRASRAPRATARRPGSSRRSSAGWPGATPTGSARRCATGRASRSASSSRWASRATSWSSPTSSTGPSSRASGSGPGAAPAPARWSPTRCASPTSTRSGTACCSSGSSTPSASRCPTSTSTSTSVGAAR